MDLGAADTDLDSITTAGRRANPATVARCLRAAEAENGAVARYNAVADESARLQAVLADVLDDEDDEDNPPAGAPGQAPLIGLIDDDSA